ncbi:hypothetical protein GCM10028811_29170 [Uliginosibacterium sediminicola]
MTLLATLKVPVLPADELVELVTVPLLLSLLLPPQLASSSINALQKAVTTALPFKANLMKPPPSTTISRGPVVGLNGCLPHVVRFLN